MSIALAALDWAKKQLGAAYSQAERNSTNPPKFDCSSLVARAYRAAGYKMLQTTSTYEVDDPGFDLLWPSSSAAIGKTFGTVAQLKAAGWTPRPGDLVFYCQDRETTRPNKITHVAFVYTADTILHARNPEKGVCFDKITLYDGSICAVTRFDEIGYDAEPVEEDEFIVDRVIKLMEGPDVRELQNALIARGYDCGPGGATGKCCTATTQAIYLFQTHNNLAADGKAGKETVLKLGGKWAGEGAASAPVTTPATPAPTQPEGVVIRMLMTRTTGAVETIALEEYLRGVVPSEMSANWPGEALKAQAVAARSYALKKIEGSKSKVYDVDDTSSYQAYNTGKIDARTDAAIKATAGVILTYNGKTAEAVYCASNGGATVSARERWGGDTPYLIAQPDPFDTRAKSGHGVGMSQHGAKARAEAGQTYMQILGFYYPGTILAKKN